MDHETCDACGFEGGRFDDGALVEAIRALGAQWRDLLDDAGDDLRTRPAAEVWSALEYAAHSRDITALHAFGVDYALTTDDATVPAIDGDAMIESAAATYKDEDVAHVADSLAGDAERLDALGQDNVGKWERTLTVGESTNTVRRMLEHALHDSTHHLGDVARGLAQIRGG